MNEFGSTKPKNEIGETFLGNDNIAEVAASPMSLKQRFDNLQAMGATRETTRAIMQADDLEGAYDNFVAVTGFAEKYGKNPNEVYATPDGVEVARAYEAQQQRDIDAEAEKALLARAREIAVSRRSQPVNDNTYHIPGTFVKTENGYFGTASTQVSQEEIDRIAAASGQIPGRDIDALGEPKH